MYVKHFVQLLKTVNIQQVAVVAQIMALAVFTEHIFTESQRCAGQLDSVMEFTSSKGEGRTIT